MEAKFKSERVKHFGGEWFLETQIVLNNDKDNCEHDDEEDEEDIEDDEDDDDDADDEEADDEERYIKICFYSSFNLTTW